LGKQKAAPGRLFETGEREGFVIYSVAACWVKRPPETF